MRFLPIVERELRVAARRPLTYWLRCGVASGVLLLLAIFTVFGPMSLSPPRVAQYSFTALGVLAFGFVILSGLFLTSDCLSMEKREGTMGLLFLTELKGYDIVLGKLASTSLQAFFALLGIFPILAIPLLMGGVSGREFWSLVLTLVATLMFSLSIGLAVSAGCRGSRQAMVTTLVLLFVFSGVAPGLWWAKELLLGGKFHPDIFLYLSPVYTFIQSIDRLSSGHFSRSFLTVCSSALGCMVLACFLLPRVWQDRPNEGTSWALHWNRWRRGNQHRRKERSYFLTENPVYWLASHDRSMSHLTGILIGSLFFFWVCFFFGLVGSTRGPRSHIEEIFTILIILTFAMHAVFKSLLCVEATRQLSEDYHSGALELLLVTPVTENDLLSGLKRATAKQFEFSKALLCITNGLFCCLMIFYKELGMDSADRLIFILIIVGGLVLLLKDFNVLVLVGLQMSLRGHRPHRATLATLLRVLIPPWLGIFLFMVVGFAFQPRDNVAKTMALAWFLWCFLWDRRLASSARAELEMGVRQLVAKSKFRVPPLRLFWPRLSSEAGGRYHTTAFPGKGARSSP